MIAIRIGVGFVAGVLGYVVFHQGAVALFHALGVFPTGAFPTRAVPFLASPPCRCRSSSRSASGPGCGGS